MKIKIILVLLFLAGCSLQGEQYDPVSLLTVANTATVAPTKTSTPTFTPNAIATQTNQAQTTRIFLDSFVTADIATYQAEIRQISHEATVTQIHRDSIREEEKLFYSPYFRVLWLAFFFLLVLFILVWLLVQSYVLYNQNKPVTYHDKNGGTFVIPANQIKNFPASLTRNLIKPIVNADEKPETIQLPEIQKGHVLIAGETGSGKTTAMKAILKHRKNIVVIDPHDDGNTWFNCQVIGGGRNYQAIADYTIKMEKELQDRFNQRKHGRTSFEPLTVVTDELPSIISEIGKKFGTIWRKWIREGRKVGLYVVMATQSTRVETLGIKGEGDLLENFNFVITLGKVAQTNYKDLTDGMKRPAVIHSVYGTNPLIIPYKPPTNPSIADPNNLLDSDKQRIIELYKKYGVLRTVQLEVFGYEGGAAYRAVKEILDKEKLL